MKYDRPTLANHSTTGPTWANPSPGPTWASHNPSPIRVPGAWNKDNS